MTVSKQSFHWGVVALDQIVPPLSINVPDAIKVRVISMVDFADDAPIGVGLIGADLDCPMQPDPFDRVAKKCPRGLCITSFGQPEVDHLTVRIDCAPQIAPLAADADVGLL